MQQQRTLHTSTQLTGPGLHTGRLTQVTLRPAPVGHGIRFRRVDLNIEIPALATSVGETSRSTAIASGDAVICTIEHLMSALHGLLIDNVLIEVTGSEVPILDGSARVWVDAILKAGIEQQEAPAQCLRITETIEMNDSKSRYRVEPADDFQLTCIIDFAGQAIGHQEYTFRESDDYICEVAPCRTFVFLHEIEPLLAHNLIKGGALDNALVFVNQPLAPEQVERLGRVYGKDPSAMQVDNGVLNTVKPFFANEPCRHKALDFIGDILLLGARPKGHFTIECPGHQHNVAFAKTILNRIK